MAACVDIPPSPLLQAPEPRSNFFHPPSYTVPAGTLIGALLDFVSVGVGRPPSQPKQAWVEAMKLDATRASWKRERMLIVGWLLVRSDVSTAMKFETKHAEVAP